jgi:glycerophosphoryl diester phosphodiesterase
MLSIVHCRVHSLWMTFLFVLFWNSTEGVAVEIIGHRGASHDAPENTLAAINLAWQRNADAVEIDVYLSKDGRIVTVHDSTTKRYGGPNRKIVDQTLAELKKIDVGTWKNKKFASERIPTLTEVLATIPKSKRLFIEIKCGPEIVPKLKQVLKTAGLPAARTTVISFSLPVVKAVKRELPELEVSWIVGLKQNKITKLWQPSLSSMIRQAKAAKLDGLDLSAKSVIDKKYVLQAKNAGLKFYVWTVNSESEARRLTEAGVDGITTDRPGWLHQKSNGK